MLCYLEKKPGDVRPKICTEGKINLEITDFSYAFLIFVINGY